MLGSEQLLVGWDYLVSVVDLLHRVREHHPTAGAWEAADLGWWWRKPRSTDERGQLFWFADDRPVAAAVTTDWGSGRYGLDVIALPQAPATGTSAWMAAPTRPPVTPLPEGYRLVSRRDLTDRAHHYVDRNGPDVERRLRETTLYRPDLDLAVLDQAGEVAAYGLF